MRRVTAHVGGRRPTAGEVLVSVIWSGVIRVVRALRTRPVLSRSQRGQRTVVSPSPLQRARNTE